MDQDNSKGQDKRNWRERLGIGAQGNNGVQGNKDLPKISDDFRKEGAPPARPAARPLSRANPTAVKPAPMAPRSAAPKAPMAPVAPDKLAERLRSQREASTKLAEQRVEVARQRAASPAAVVAQPVRTPAPPPPVQAGPKPKFTFAEEDAKAAAPQSPKPAQPARPVSTQPPMAPARPPLGGPVPPTATPAFPPRTATPPAYVPPASNGYVPPAGVPPLGYQPGYAQQPVPPYRPIDPAAVPGGYVPRNYAPPPPPAYVPGQGPRLNVPPRPTAPPPPQGYAPPQDLGANRPARIAPTAQPPQSDYDSEFYDEMPTPRAGQRPSRTDYQQAYREAEYGYEEEAPRSRAPWILAGLLLMALLVAGGGVWFYQNSLKPMMSGQSGTQEVPVVAPPETPAKVEAEPQAAQPQPAGGATPTKKQIYDRIVGDQEVLGGEVTTPVEAPAAIPEPTNDAPATQPVPSGSGDDAAPLPIPPPPGASDQQGSLGTASDKQSAETITPAASESQAAVAAQGIDKPAETEVAVAPPKAAPEPPAPGELEKPQAEAEAIVDEPPPPVKKKPVIAKRVAEKPATRSLGAKPVVLVPPSKKAKAAAAKSTRSNADEVDVADAGDGGLYGGTTSSAEPIVAPAQPQPVKKKKTLADLFNNSNDDASTAEAPESVAAINPPAQPKPAAPRKIAAAPEAALQEASGGPGFVVQLASFRTQTEATTEYSRLKAKNSGALGRYSPIITKAEIGGSTRYRLSVGRMDSQAQANAVCSSLFANGERDCLVKRQ